MKKILLASSLIVLGMSSAFAADGTITINGLVTDSTCVINAGTPDFVVTLPTVNKSALANAGQTAGRTAFAINLTGCTPETNVATYFEPGSTVDLATGRLNTAAGAGSADEVQVQLLGSNNLPISLLATNGVPQTNSQSVATTSGAAELNYYAEYYATGTATPGTVNTSVQYTIIYP